MNWNLCAQLTCTRIAKPCQRILGYLMLTKRQKEEKSLPLFLYVVFGLLWLTDSTAGISMEPVSPLLVAQD